MAGSIEIGQLDVVSPNGLQTTALTTSDAGVFLVDGAMPSYAVASSTNAQHITRQSNWIYNEDGTVTGALQFKITGLYTQSLSGSMKIVVTQNGVADGVYPDYEFDIAGNWRSSDHLWHNTEARVSTSNTGSMNVRFCNNGTDVFIVIGDVSTVWNYPRIVVKDIVSNALIAGYTPDFVISRITTLPSTVNVTISVANVGVGYGQTWQDVTTSRVIGVTYTNSTGKPIQLYALSNGSALGVIINGVTLVAGNTYPYASNNAMVIPNGATYSLTSGTASKWLELR